MVSATWYSKVEPASSLRDGIVRELIVHGYSFPDYLVSLIPSARTREELADTMEQMERGGVLRRTSDCEEVLERYRAIGYSPEELRFVVHYTLVSPLSRIKRVLSSAVSGLQRLIGHKE